MDAVLASLVAYSVMVTMVAVVSRGQIRELCRRNQGLFDQGVGLKFALAAALLLLTACGPADSGTRHGTPDARVGKFSLFWWGDATPGEEAWLVEAATEHIALLEQTVAGHLEPIHETAVVVLKTRGEVAAARNAVGAASGGALPPWVVSALLTHGGIGFVDGGVIYLYAGDRLELPISGDLMLQTVLADPTHRDLRWPQFLLDDWTISLQIFARR